MKSRTFNYLLLASLLALGACGGGGGGGVDSGGIGGTGIVATGVMTNGSIILNSVHYDDTTVKNVSDDPLGGTSTSPDDGKVIKLRGRRNDDGINGTAETVEIENEVRGTVQSENAAGTPQSFVVVNQTVTIDDLTICSNFATSDPVTKKCGDPLSEITPSSSFVEVHGLRLADGSIRASRVELLAANPGGVDEVRGIVNAAAGTSFQLVNGGTTVTVNYSGTPAVTDGQLVEVHGAFNGTAFTATRVDIEDLEDDEFEPGDNGEFEVEGFVSDCPANNPCGSVTFSVGNQLVKMTTNLFENGAADDLVNGVRIEAKGHFIASSGTLMADKIKFKRVKIEVTGSATVTGSVPGGGTIHIMGITILTDDFTEADTSDSITNERLEIRGYLDSGGQIIAERVKDNVGGGSDQIVRGPVTNKVSNTLRVLGIDVLLTSSTVLQDGAITDLSQFLGLVTAAPSPSGTVIKAKGSFAGGTLTADEAEIED